MSEDQTADLAEVFGNETPDAGVEPGETAANEAESAPAAPEQSETQQGESDAPAREQKPRVDGVQRRIDELTAKRYEAERQAAEERGRRETMEKMLSERLTPQGQHQPAQAVEDEQAPDPAKYDGTSEDKSALAYMRDLAAWNGRQEAKRIIAATIQQAQETDRARVQRETEAAQRMRQEEITRQGEDAFGDFMGVVAPLIRSGIIPPVMMEAAMSEKNAHEVFYYLSKRPAEAQRISQLSPVSQVREIGRLADRIAAHKSKSTQTSAPPPITPATTSTGTLTKDPSKMTDSEWEASRKAALAKAAEKSGRGRR